MLRLTSSLDAPLLSIALALIVPSAIAAAQPLPAPRAALQLAPPVAAESSSSSDEAVFAERPHAPELPEPMVFDLVRGLGARQWEVEANALFMLPTDPNDWAMSWAPEIEVALADGFAVELELPMRNEHVEALKTAAQLTFGTAMDGRFIHGTQAIVEYELEHARVQTSLLYLAGISLDSTWGILAMAGARTTAGEDGFLRVEALVNLNLFAHVLEWLTLGVEANYADDLSIGRSLRLVPQVHVQMGDHLRWQVGAGLTTTEGEHRTFVSTRLIAEL